MLHWTLEMLTLMSWYSLEQLRQPHPPSSTIVQRLTLFGQGRQEERSREQEANAQPPSPEADIEFRCFKTKKVAVQTEQTQ
jgi:hypothetical protein